MNLPSKNGVLSLAMMYYLEQEKEIISESTTLLCVIQGHALLTCEGSERELHSGDLILLKDVDSYRLKPLEKTLFLSNYFDYIFFREQFGEDYELLQCDSARIPHAQYDNIRYALINLALAQTAPAQNNQFLIRQRIFQLFHLLKAYCIKEETQESAVKKSKSLQKQEQLLSYLKENFCATPSITLNSTAEHMGYTPQYLANFIKKQFGVTFNTYLQELRLDAAVTYLKYREFPPEQISLLCGFPNTGSFQNSFTKKFGQSPAEYRAQYRDTLQNNYENIFCFTDHASIRDHLHNNMPVPDPSLMSPIEETAKTCVICDVQKSTPLPHVWTEIINLGQAANLESPTFRSHLKRVVDELHFRYGRVDGILQLTQAYSTPHTQLAFDFRRIFAVIDYMRSVGLRPFLDLGDKSTEIYLPGQSAVNDPIDESYKRLQTVLPALLRQCINYYGYSEVETWKFEVWRYYEDRQLTMIEDPEKYCRRFSFVHQTIKSMIPGAQVGGPGHNTVVDASQLTNTLACMKKHGLVPDFLSVYVFPYVQPERLQKEVLLAKDPDFFKKALAQTRESMAACDMAHIPLYVTEFCSFIGFRGHINDSLHQAAFIVKHMLDNHQSANAFAYWIASDYTIEYPGNNKFLFSGNGLMSQHGIRKPGFHAFAFLANLGEQLIAQGENYIVTRADEDYYHILLYNYAHYTSHFCEHAETFDMPRYPDAAFLDVAPLHLDLTLTNLPAGMYKVSHDLLSAEHGCAFHEWARLNFVSELNEYEVMHLRETCTPHLTIQMQQIDSSLQLDNIVNKNEVLFICVERIR